MAVQENTWNVANRMHSNKDSDNPALNHIITGADEIYDDAKGKKQSVINDDTARTLAEHTNAINAIDSQNYADYTASAGQTLNQILPAVGSADTIYRVGKWDGSQYDATSYAEYVWSGTAYTLMDVKAYGIDEVPTANSENLVKSSGIYEECVEAGQVVGDPVGDWVESDAQTYVDNRIAEIRGGVSPGFNTLKKLQDVYTSLAAEKFATVPTYASLPASGSTDTLYRVSSYDGTQIDATKYAEYAWNGSAYVLLAVRSQIDQVFDISEYNNATYNDLADALSDTNVPVGVRKGGMSVKYVCTSDKKYVQYRLMSDTFNITPSNWQGVDDVPTAGSHNLPDSSGTAVSIQKVTKNIEKTFNLDVGETPSARTKTPCFFKSGEKIVGLATIGTAIFDTEVTKQLNISFYRADGTSIISHSVINAYTFNLSEDAYYYALYAYKVVTAGTVIVNLESTSSLNKITETVINQKNVVIPGINNSLLEINNSLLEINSDICDNNVTKIYEDSSFPVTNDSIGIIAKQGQTLKVNVSTTGSVGGGWSIYGKKIDGATTLIMRYYNTGEREATLTEDYVDLLLNISENANTGTATFNVLVENWRNEVDEAIRLTTIDRSEMNQFSKNGKLLETANVISIKDSSNADKHLTGRAIDSSGNLTSSSNNEVFYFNIEDAANLAIYNTELYGTTSVSVIAFYSSTVVNSNNLIDKVLGNGGVGTYNNIPVPTNCKLVAFTNRVSAPHTAIIELQKTIPFTELIENIAGISGGNIQLVESGNYVAESSIVITRSFSKVSSFPMVINSYTKYTGNAAPTIQYSVGAYTSLTYTIGSVEFVNQQWRIPSTLEGMTASVVVSIPAGTTLYVKNLCVTQESSVQRPSLGVIFESHLGLQSYAPENTMAAYEAAAMCGYPSCIVTPLVTSDEEIILYHSGTEILTNDGGITKVGFSAAQIAEMTYAQIQEYDVYKGASMAQFFDCKVPTLEQFFALCSRTGMKPTFSAHVNFSSTIWNKIKMLLLKYGLGGQLSIKAFHISILNSAYSYLGKLIYYNILGVSNQDLVDLQEYCDNLDATAFVQGGINTGIQMDADVGVTAEKVEYIISRGYQASVWNVFRHLTGDGYKTYMSYGISNFTDDVNCNNGLNW